MSDLRTAAQQALEAMEKNTKHLPLHFDNYFEAMNALRAAIIEAEIKQDKQRKPLTDEEINALELPPSGTATVRDLVRLIERAHGIK